MTPPTKRKVAKCFQCGKTEEHFLHIRYGNDINNPRKHEFVPMPDKPKVAMKEKKGKGKDKHICNPQPGYFFGTLYFQCGCGKYFAIDKKSGKLKES
jgi:hypothetical protein